MATQAVARVEEPRNVRALLQAQSAQAKIVPFLPRGTDVERVIASTILATKQNPGLLQCDGESIVLAVAKIQQWGLEIGTTAHLVPFGKDCVPVADYKGLAELMVRSGAVRHVEARAVYAGDEFQCEQGLEPILRHIPEHGAKRGKIIGAYAILRLPFGRSAFEFMPIEDIDAIRRAHSKQWKHGECPAWYAKKTVVRQIAKLIPKDARLASALRVIDEERGEEFEDTLVSPDAETLRDEDRIEAPAAAQLTEGEAAPAAELALDDARPQPRRRNAQED